jgi:hypothetical protein
MCLAETPASKSSACAGFKIFGLCAIQTVSSETLPLGKLNSTKAHVFCTHKNDRFGFCAMPMFDGKLGRLMQLRWAVYRVSL